MDSKLIDKLIEQQETIKIMQENEDNCLKIMKMYEECKKKINKAIEYIEKEKVIKEGNTLEQITNYEKNILKILKGENNE